jgi:Fur family transcriptional regulator, peroxide stress response regulator
MGELRLVDSNWRANYSAHRLSEFVQRCRARRLSITPQRMAIIQALVAAENHPSAEEICAVVRRKHPHVSLATVHRILEQFCQVGEARKVTALHGSARYDGHVEPHHHVLCVRCRRVQDVEMPEINGLIKNLAHLGEFELLACSLEIEGVCKQCRMKERKDGVIRSVQSAGPVAAKGAKNSRQRTAKSLAAEGSSD